MIYHKNVRTLVLSNQEPAYKRVLLKLSGEAISNGANGILNFDYIEKIAQVIKKCLDKNVQIAVLVGAGNIWRGRRADGRRHLSGVNSYKNNRSTLEKVLRFFI